MKTKNRKIEKIIRDMFWFLPTSNEQRDYEEYFVKSCIKNISLVKEKIKSLENQEKEFAKTILQSDQAENFIRLQSIHQQICLQNMVLENLYKEVSGYVNKIEKIDGLGLDIQK
jgi:hypothetical protein